MRVYAIVYQQPKDHECHLAGPDPYAPHHPYPAFTSEEAANKFIKSLKFNSNLRVQLLEVR